MASSVETSPPPLKSKLTQVKYLLDDANKRLHEEMSKNYEIFTTKTSASGASNLQYHQQQQKNAPREHKEPPFDIKRTISDISTLKSVLSCPIFDRIVNVTDSLDKLSYHLNLHPSIGPSDINIDSNGELILAPPIEPAANNLINSKLEYSDQLNLSPHILNPHLIQGSNNQILMTTDHQFRQAQPLSPGYVSGTSSELNCGNGFSIMQQQQDLTNLFNQQYTSHELIREIPASYAPQMMNNTVNQANFFDTEKLVSNGANKTYAVSSKAKRQHQGANMKTDCSGNDENRRLYKSNGHFNLDQDLSDNIDLKNVDFHSTQSMNQVGQNGNHSNDLIRNGFTNEMYKTTHELNQTNGAISMDQQKHAQYNGKTHPDSYMRNNQLNNASVSTNGKARSSQNSGMPFNKGNCSPSTSAGSTVRLADECDSGASSYQSHSAKPSYPYKSNEHIIDNQTVIASSNKDSVEAMEQELIDKLSPEMERIKVTLEKDSTGLGITIAGYTCEKEEISGIFIKSITPNSPADRSGKIRTLDQIFAVNGRELLGYNNKDAVNVLRNTGKVVKLELMRYLVESKYQKLQTALAHAVPTLNTNSRLVGAGIVPSQSNQKISARTSSNSTGSPSKSSIPVSKARDSNQSPTKPLTSPNGRQPSTLVQVTNYQQSTGNAAAESIYKNETLAGTTSPIKGSIVKNVVNQINNSQNQATSDSNSHIPVAAQRGSNKVIETKQGARNTIDIRSPVCQPSDATYVNKIAEFDFCDSASKNVNKTMNYNGEASDEFRKLIKSKEPEWEKEVEIIAIHKDSSQGLGFIVKDYNNPKDPNQSIIMITSLTPGGIAERDGRLSSGDLLIFVDDVNLEGASLEVAVKALKKTNSQVTLGVLKLKRT